MEDTAKKNGKENKVDILDELKAMEKAVKKMVLIKMLSLIKKMSHEILVLKEKCNVLLDEVGIADEDTKRIIDFVNNQSTVRLTKVDKEDIRDWAKEEVEKTRDGLEQKAEKNDGLFPATIFMNSPLSSKSLIGSSADPNFPQTYTTDAGWKDEWSNNGITLCSNDAGGGKLEVKI